MRHIPSLLLLSALACSDRGAGSPANGELTAQWSGSAAGRFRAPATARWCARDSLLELIAVRSDTAVGFAILPKDSLAAGTYSIFSTQVFIAFRPQATAAVRWLDIAELKGFEGTSGNVIVTGKDAAGVSGTFDVALRRTGAADTLRIAGRFVGVRVEESPEICGRANRPGAG